MTIFRDLLSHLKTEEEIMFCARQQEVMGWAAGSHHLSPVLLLLFRTFLSQPCLRAGAGAFLWSLNVECVCCQQQPWTAFHTLTNSQHWADAELCKVPIYLGFAKHMPQILNNLFQDNVVCVCFAYALVKIMIFYWNRNFTYCFCF